MISELQAMGAHLLGLARELANEIDRVETELTRARTDLTAERLESQRLRSELARAQGRGT